MSGEGGPGKASSGSEKIDGSSAYIDAKKAAAQIEREKLRKKTLSTETWYELKQWSGDSGGAKKGMKLVKLVQIYNPDGSAGNRHSVFVGFEKKLPQNYLKKLYKDGLLKGYIPKELKKE